MTLLSHFHTIPACYGQTERIVISISRVSVLTRVLSHVSHPAVHTASTCSFRVYILTLVS